MNTPSQFRAPIRALFQATTSVMWIALALGAAGCGKSLPKLTEEQKAALSETLASASRGANTVGDVTNGSPLPAGPSLFAVGSVLRLPGYSHDDSQLRMETRLRTAQVAHSCEFSSTLPSMADLHADPLPNVNANIKVSGNSCPVAADFEVSTIKTGAASVHGSAQLAYSVRDTDFAQLNDVVAITLNGGYDATGKRDHADVTANFTGTLASQKHGSVNFTLKVDASGPFGGQEQPDSAPASGKLEANFVFKDFEADFVLKSDGQVTSYKINDELVSRQEFEKYFESLWSSAPARH